MNEKERDALRLLREGIELQVELAARRGFDVSLAAAAGTAKCAALLAATRGRQETATLLRGLADDVEQLPPKPGQAAELARMRPAGSA